eukprot:m.481931 g.481931  ORF g.481931 m.481931 type:complete len:366 (-) comp22386_c0_seq1:259-1356(-)
MSSFLRTANKKMQRQSEKLLQKVTKREGTKDEDYDEAVANFTKQQTQATRLFKESQNYLKAIRGAIEASRTFGEAIKAVYEPEWPNSDDAYATIETMDVQFNEFAEKINSSIVEPMNDYLQTFPDYKARIAKRDRKVIDFDRARRAQEVAREKQSSKLEQAEKEFADAKRLFTEINEEVHDVLPAFFVSRVNFYGTMLAKYYATEIEHNDKANETASAMKAHMEAIASNESLTNPMPRERSVASADPPAAEAASASPIAEPAPQSVPAEVAEEHPQVDLSEPAAAAAEEPSAAEASGELPADVLEIRFATHAYEGQDEDELTFAKGDRIEVIPFAEPEDEDDGWLNGRLANGKTGVFPKNFTRDA